MSISAEREILLSQLVDGELPADQANRVLAGVFDELGDVLDDSEAGSKLRAMLQLRQALEPWRRQEPPKTIVAPPRTHHAPRDGFPQAEREEYVGVMDFLTRSVRSTVGLATAALVGGILVAGGFYLGSRHVNPPQGQVADRPSAVMPSLVTVTPEQRSEIARAFSLHESVAGPLSWYAADDSTIQVAPAQKGETLRQPIAVILHLAGDRSCAGGEAMPAKSYTIVCRSNEAATIELPQAGAAQTVHLRLLSTAANGQVNLQYALAADGSDRGLEEAALAGRRHIGLDQTSLGQLALNDCLVNVDASAWVISDQR